MWIFGWYSQTINVNLWRHFFLSISQRQTALTSIRFQVELKIRNIYVGQVSRL